MSLKVNFIGRLGTDAETVTTTTTPFISLRVAVSERINGENTTTWVSVNADYERFKKFAQFLTKGSVVNVTGSLRCSIYYSKSGQAGIDRKVSADSIEFVNLGKKPTVDAVKGEEVVTPTAAPTAAPIPEMTTGGLRPNVAVPPTELIEDPFAAATASAGLADDLPF